MNGTTTFTVRLSGEATYEIFTGRGSDLPSKRASLSTLNIPSTDPIVRTYADFSALCTNLRAEFPGNIVLDPPSRLSKKASSEATTKHLHLLQMLLNEIASHPYLWKSASLKNFILPEDGKDVTSELPTIPVQYYRLYDPAELETELENPQTIPMLMQKVGKRLEASERYKKSKLRKHFKSHREAAKKRIELEKRFASLMDKVKGDMEQSDFHKRLQLKNRQELSDINKALAEKHFWEVSAYTDAIERDCKRMRSEYDKLVAVKKKLEKEYAQREKLLNANQDPEKIEKVAESIKGLQRTERDLSQTLHLILKVFLSESKRVIKDLDDRCNRALLLFLEEREHSALAFLESFGGSDSVDEGE